MNIQEGDKNMVLAITGATGGIGDPLSMALAQAGLKLGIFGRKMEKVSDLVNRIGQTSATGIVVDGSDLKGTYEGLKQTEKVFGSPVRFVINSVGTWKLTDLKLSDFDKETANMREQIDSILVPTNTVGLASQMYFCEREGGTIINMSSHVVDDFSLTGDAVYRGVKLGAEATLASIKADLNATGYEGKFQVVNILPSLVDTPTNREMLSHIPDSEWKKAVQVSSIADCILSILRGENSQERIHLKGDLVV